MKGLTLPNFDSRSVFVGKTGCGKTTLAEKICSVFDYCVILDSKGELNWKGYEIVKSLSDLKRIRLGRVIWQPNIYEQNVESYEDFFKWIYDRKNTVVYIDEVLAICKNSQSLPFWYKAILTRGRSRGIGCLNSTQAPVYIPHFILSQSEHFFVFQMRLDSDREKIEKITGIDKNDLERLKNHEFYYADDKTFFPKKLKLRLH